MIREIGGEIVDFSGSPRDAGRSQAIRGRIGHLKVLSDRFLLSQMVIWGIHENLNCHAASVVWR
jgi:hypothetical protein